MSGIDKKVIFRFADMDDIDNIMQFLSLYWSSDHILANNRDFFIYEFVNDQKVNFLLAIDREKGDILGVYGFYPYSPTQKYPLDMAGGPSRVSPKCPYPMVGLEMYRRLPQLLNIRTGVGVGLNKDTSLQLAGRILHYHTGKMKQYYILNDMNHYRIARIINKVIYAPNENVQYDLQMINPSHLFSEFGIDSHTERIPFKDSAYIKKRYIDHPVYKYTFWGMQGQMVLVGREQQYDGAKVYRIVDVLGDIDQLRYAGHALRKMVIEREYEYIDLWEIGIKDEIMEAAGFVYNDGIDNVIPSYFEPFEQRNIDIYFSSSDEKAVLFKGDADQDRPNKWRGKQ